ncbi:biopolymer transporter ExbD [Saccharophagus sp. K07]|uniref:ExbD/TolR family protein n=1 Tax=Saccharophagus sp. K07 TaxID=2283636 RepID=UPI001651CD42|nr:biopolymer transporter ExbD [Saccharophagus sp. K07]
MKQSMHASRMARRHKRAKTQPKLNLVSLMDIFTILVFFLLVNSSEVEVLQSNKSIKLPESVSDKKPENNLIVMVSRDDIVINGRLITDVKSVVESSAEDIEPLKKELEYLASREPYASDEAHEKGRDVTIMGDAALPYTLLKKIITTCAKSEYRNISLAVNQLPPETQGGG